MVQIALPACSLAATASIFLLRRLFGRSKAKRAGNVVPQLCHADRPLSVHLLVQGKGRIRLLYTLVAAAEPPSTAASTESSKGGHAAQEAPEVMPKAEQPAGEPEVQLEPATETDGQSQLLTDAEAQLPVPAEPQGEAQAPVDVDARPAPAIEPETHTEPPAQPAEQPQQEQAAPNDNGHDGEAGGEPPRRSVTMAPSVDAEQRERVKKPLILADVLRELARAKKRNAKLKQRLANSQWEATHPSSSEQQSTNSVTAGEGSGSASARKEQEQPSKAPATPPKAVQTTADASPSQADQQRGGGSSACGQGAVPRLQLPTVSEIQPADPQPGDGSMLRREGGEVQAGGSRGAGGRGKLTVGHLLRERVKVRDEQTHLVGKLAKQEQNAQLMSAFVELRDENQALKDTISMLDGGSTPTNGSELGSFKDRLLAWSSRSACAAQSLCSDTSSRQAPPSQAGSLYRRLGGRYPSLKENMRHVRGAATDIDGRSTPASSLVDGGRSANLLDLFNGFGGPRVPSTVVSEAASPRSSVMGMLDR